MNAERFFNQIRTYINNNATEPRAGFRANFLSLAVGNYEFAIEGRGRGRGFVTVRRDQVIIASECPLSGVFNADDAIGATLAILELQDKQRGEDAIALGDDVALLADVTSDRAAQSAIETARQMIASGSHGGRLKTEVESYDRHARIIADCKEEGRTPGRNILDGLMVADNYIKQYVAAFGA